MVILRVLGHEFDMSQFTVGKLAIRFDLVYLELTPGPADQLSFARRLHPLLHLLTAPGPCAVPSRP